MMVSSAGGHKSSYSGLDSKNNDNDSVKSVSSVETPSPRSSSIYRDYGMVSATPSSLSTFVSQVRCVDIMYRCVL